MSIAGRILRSSHSWRSLISYSKSLNPSRHLQSMQPHGRWLKLERLDAFEGAGRGGGTCAGGHSLYVLPILASFFIGIGSSETNYAHASANVYANAAANADEATGKHPLPSEVPSGHLDLEEIARKERQRLEGLLKSKGKPYGSVPRFTVAVKGQKITIKFQVPQGCEVPRLIANLSSNLGLKADDRGGGAEMGIRAWDSSIAWQITLSRPQEPKDSGKTKDPNAGELSSEGDLVVLIFRSLISTDKPEIEFIKEGTFSSSELDALASVLQLAGERTGQNKGMERKPTDGSAGSAPIGKSLANLEAMGVRVFGIDDPHTGKNDDQISWETIAGYDQQKREIEDTILLALKSPEIYDDIARGTRCKFETNRPRAVLFEGPPGTGKTSSARVIANQAGVPLLYVPLEVVMSKYYGESERLLGKVFTLANELPDGAIIFLDEAFALYKKQGQGARCNSAHGAFALYKKQGQGARCNSAHGVDSFAVARDSEMHEATRRILSVLLRQIDGFEQDKKVVVIAATNRKQDLDPALISRFDSIITFGLPDQENRIKIAAQYAKHLTSSELAEFASNTEGMSGRDIRDVCQQAERRWASKIIRSQGTEDVYKEGLLPPLREYIYSAASRRDALLAIEYQRRYDSRLFRDKRPLDMA